MPVRARILLVAAAVLVSLVGAAVMGVAAVSAQAGHPGLLVIENGQVVTDRGGVVLKIGASYTAPYTGTARVVCDRCPPCMVFLIGPPPDPNNWRSGYIPVNVTFPVQAGVTYTAGSGEEETQQACGRLPDGRFRYSIR